MPERRRGTRDLARQRGMAARSARGRQPGIWAAARSSDRRERPSRRLAQSRTPPPSLSCPPATVPGPSRYANRPGGIGGSGSARKARSAPEVPTLSAARPGVVAPRPTLPQIPSPHGANQDRCASRGQRRRRGRRQPTQRLIVGDDRGQVSGVDVQMSEQPGRPRSPGPVEETCSGCHRPAHGGAPGQGLREQFGEPGPAPDPGFLPPEPKHAGRPVARVDRYPGDLMGPLGVDLFPEPGCLGGARRVSPRQDGRDRPSRPRPARQCCGRNRRSRPRRRPVRTIRRRSEIWSRTWPTTSRSAWCGSRTEWLGATFQA